MSIEILTPVSTAKAVELSRGKYTKQILPLTSIQYGGKQKKFDLAYCAKVVDAFRRRAYPYMPVKLAPADNAHTQDVLRTGGKVVGLELSNTDGLVATLELNEDGAKAVELSGGELPVSVRLVEGLTHSDGATFDVALHHVLLTDDPNIREQGPWAKVDLSAETREDGVTETINLSAERFGTEGTMTDTKARVELSLTKAQQTALLELAAEHAELQELGLKAEDFEPETEGDGDEEDADAETEDEEADTDGAVTKKPADVKLTAGAGGDVVELARAEAAEAKAHVVQLTRKLHIADVDREVKDFQDRGLAPAILELARPALEEPVVIELSNGKKTDAGAVMRKVLNQVIELARTDHAVVDLNVTSGVLTGGASSAEEMRAGQLKWLDENYG